MLALAFAGRLSPGLRWMSAGLFGLIALQYATATARFATALAISRHLAALHPVTALLVFGASIATLSRARRQVGTGEARRREFGVKEARAKTTQGPD